MKIHWLSNAPWSPTGYGNQTKVFVERLKNDLGHEMSITAFYGLDGGRLNLNNMMVYPKGFDPFGQDIVSANCQKEGAQFFISLLDSWVCKPEIYLPGVKWIPWFPIDSEPLPPPVLHKVKQAYKRIVFSKFGCQMMDNAGLDYFYVPHGVDTKILRPIPPEDARKSLEWPNDKFIVGMVAANKGNPSRKAFAENFEAFAKFKETHKDVMLYCHTHATSREGVQLERLCEFLGLKVGEDVIFPPEYQYMMGFPDEYMAMIYSAMDVHLLVTMGEGFGIPTVEAQACGCPVIVGDWTASGELCFSGWKVPKSEADGWYTPLEAYQYKPRVGAIVDALLMAYKKKGNLHMRELARHGAEKYDADLVTKKYWKPVLKKIEESIQEDSNRKWAKVGVWGEDGKLHVPDLAPGSNDEKVIDPESREETIIPDGFSNVVNGIELDIEDDPEGGVSKLVMREIEQDYDFDSIDFQDGDVVLDIGAHVGVVSIYLAKKYPGIKIISFEPVKENYELLLKNINANKVKNVTPWGYAVTCDGRPIAMEGDISKNSGGSKIGGNGETDISSITLEEIIAEDLKIKLLKIDCEGAEYEIIEANPEILKHVEYVRGEIHPMPGKDPQALLDLICKYVKKENVKMTILKGRK